MTKERYNKRMEYWKAGKDADMEFIEQTVYDGLKKALAGIAAPLEKIQYLEGEIKSGFYNDVGVRHMNAQITDLRIQRRRAINEALNAAKAQVNAYREYVEKRGRLDPAQLTDDIKLLQPGIVLTDRDFIGMMERNAGNSTMEQAILRAAKERGIDIGMNYTEIDEQRRADEMNDVIHYFERWIDNDKAGAMLDKFFGKYGPDVVDMGNEETA